MGERTAPMLARAGISCRTRHNTGMTRVFKWLAGGVLVALLVLGGVLSVAFGIVMLVSPGSGALALIWVVASYAIAYGVLLVAFSFRLRRHATT